MTGFLKTPKLTAKLRRAQSSSQTKMYIRRINAMNVPFKFETARLKADETALIDSGATENFIDEDTWKRLGIGRNQLHEKIILTNVDGTGKPTRRTHPLLLAPSQPPRKGSAIEVLPYRL
jgi:hypothetical protein